MLDSIRVVLVQPSHPGNIGAAARAMKTMGLSRLYLVAPRRPLDEEALALAAGAAELLEQAVICPDLAGALADCHLVYGSSSRERFLSWPKDNVRQAAQGSLEAVAGGQQVALVFGCERTGLTNEQLYLCHRHLLIPANPDYCSLNVAAAVQIVAYEIWQAAQAVATPILPAQPGLSQPATQGELEGLIQHLEQLLLQIGFLDPTNPRLIMPKLRRLLQRNQIEAAEIHILRGILTAMGRALTKEQGAHHV